MSIVRTPIAQPAQASLEEALHLDEEGRGIHKLDAACCPKYIQAVPKTERADQDGGSSSSIEASIKTCCDNVQKRLQKEFDKNLDIFDRYVKMNVAAVAEAVASGPGAAEATVEALTGGGTGGRGNGAAGGWGARDAGAGLQAPTTADAGASAGASGGGGEGTKGVGGEGASGSSSEKRGRRAAGDADAWALDGEEAGPPKRLEEEEALDAEIQQLRKRRREVCGHLEDVDLGGHRGRGTGR